MDMTGDRTEREQIDAAIRKARRMRAEAFAAFFEFLQAWLVQRVNAAKNAPRARAKLGGLGHDFKTEALP